MLDNNHSPFEYRRGRTAFGALQPLLVGFVSSLALLAAITVILVDLAHIAAAHGPGAMLRMVVAPSAVVLAFVVAAILVRALFGRVR